MKNLFFKLTIFYNAIFALALIFTGIQQWYEYDKVWPLILIIFVALPMVASHVFLIIHVMRIIPFLTEFEHKAKMYGVRHLYPPSKGQPVTPVATKEVSTLNAPIKSEAQVQE